MKFVGKINNIEEMFSYLDAINNPDDDEYDYCKMESYGLYGVYEKILGKVLSLNERPKRVVDIGSLYNQYAYMFENEGIDYIGIDLWNKNKQVKPYESDRVKFIGAKYEDVADEFKDDVVISDLCVGYLVKIEDVKAKHLIINDLNDETHEFDAKIVW